MKRIVQKIKSYSKSIELAESDKEGIRARLVDFMQAHPILPEVEDAKQRSNIKSPYAAFLHIIKRPLVISALIAIIAGGGITYAAEGTLPGDVLYPVKIYVSENLYSAFIFGEKAEASWYTHKAERRLEEIQILLVKGELDKQKAIIAQAHLDAALKEAEKYSKDQEEFQAALEAHAAVLARIDRDRVLADSAVNSSIVSALNTTNHRTQKEPIKTEDVLSVVTLDSATERMNIAKERIELVATAINKLHLDREVSKRVQNKMDKARSTYKDASTALADGNYTLAQDQFIESMMILQEAKLIASVPKFVGFEDTANTPTSDSVQSE